MFVIEEMLPHPGLDAPPLSRKLSALATRTAGFDAIAITETQGNNVPGGLRMKTTQHADKKCGEAGGVAMLVHQNLTKEKTPFTTNQANLQMA